MIVLLASDPLRVDPPPGWSEANCSVHGTWESLHDVLPEADCCVVATSSLGDSQLRSRIDSLRRSFPLTATLLLTGRDSENLLWLNEIDVDGVRLLPADEGALPFVVRDLLRSSLRERLARTIEQSYHIPANLRVAIAEACRGVDPVRSVNRLSSRARESRVAVWSQWTAAFDGSPACRVTDLVNGIMLIRALELRSAGTGWRDVADGLGVSTRSLDRWCRREVELSLGRIGQLNALPIACRYLRALGSRLLRNAELHNGARGNGARAHPRIVVRQTVKRR